jgi:acyl carrier protein
MADVRRRTATGIGFHGNARDAPRPAPHGPTERAVAALFTELLSHERIGVDDNFFALGGHSLLAARLVALVRQEFDVELTLLDLFDNPTVAGVVAFIEGVTGATS